MLGRFSKTSLNFFQYVKDNRKELVEKNNKKYGSTKLNTRVKRRRNITNKLKGIINTLIVSIRASTPIETGNAKMNGIGYRVYSRYQAVVTVGSPSAPYVVYLNRTSNRYRGGANAGRTLSNWIDNAVSKAEKEIYSIYPDVQISVSEYSSVAYIEIYIPPEEED